MIAPKPSKWLELCAAWNNPEIRRQLETEYLAEVEAQRLADVVDPSTPRRLWAEG